ncbi:hypothetical protein GCM10010251_83380 [Streptomyces aurantiogriseus]|uniref:Uncharacterized protein n=1 Tax=Streptomyces aurantiogriseus TaxID=66870 RepID=A0A918FNH6_9ACTN|nr:hypothetical protein GCM10010251_83380 [Streptomyces aurantiogriseus]
MGGAQGAAFGEVREVVVGAADGVAEHGVDGALAAEDGEEAVGEEVGGAGLGLRGLGEGAAWGGGGVGRAGR